jgi:DNA polymerase (family 10)
MDNKKIADIFDELADLLELRDANAFRVRAYRDAAQSIRGLSEPLADVVEEGKSLEDIPDIGESSAEKIREILKTGTVRQLTSLRKKVPGGLDELLHVPGLGPKRVRQLNDVLGVQTLKQLEEACENHEVREIEGMGATMEENILEGIRIARQARDRMRCDRVSEHLNPLSEYLDGIDSLEEWVVAGSWRRRRETVGDLDVLLRSSDREDTIEKLVDYDDVADVMDRGTEKTSVRLQGGLRVDFRFFDADTCGSALVYFTGSKSHNIALRKRAQSKGWKLNEYGLMKGDTRLASKTEEAIYSRFGLDWIPPELRENRGELEWAEEGRLPDLVERDDIRGDLHAHTTKTDGKLSIREMAEAARDVGYDYLAITDHSKRLTMANGLDDDQALKHADAIREVDGDMNRFWLLAGIECDILEDGSLDLKEKTLEQLDWVVASIHYDYELPREKMTDRIVSAVSSGVVHCLGHPMGRKVGKRDEMNMDLDRVFEACAEHNVAVEINAQPKRLDLPDTYCQQAKEAGLRFVINTDAHSARDLENMRFGLSVARRGGLEKNDIINTQHLTDLRQMLS